jgi:membrane protein EpsK
MAPRERLWEKGMKTSILSISATALGFVASFLYGILLTPFLVRNLELSVYGLLPLSFSLVAYCGILTQTICASLIGRLVKAHDDEQEFNAIFTISLWIALGVGAVVLLSGWSLLPYLGRVIVIPAGHDDDARRIFGAVVAAFALSIIAVPFTSVLFVLSKVYIIALLQAMQTIARALLIVILFSLFSASIGSVSLAIVTSGLLFVSMSIAIAYRQQNTLAFRPRCFSAATALDMLRTSGGVCMTQLGTLMIFNVDMLLVNHLAGADESARFAAAAQWAVVLRGLGVSVAGVFSPDVMKLYVARRSSDDLAQFVRSVSAYCGAFIALPAGFLAGVSPELLTIWIGSDVASQWPVMAVSSFGAVVATTALPAWMIFLAANKVYLPGSVTILSGCFVIIGAVLASRLPVPIGAAVAGAVVMAQICQASLFTMPYAAHTTNRKLTEYSFPLAQSFVFFLASAGLSHLSIELAQPTNFVHLAICGVLITPFYALVVYLSMPRTDRAELSRNVLVMAEKLRAALP